MTIKEKNGIEISLDKGSTVQSTHESQAMVPRPMHQMISPPAPPVQSMGGGEVIDSSKCITSPMVGTFYVADSPESPPLVKVGDLINKGDTLCIIEAMKVMNDVKSDRSGKIVRILIENGSPVEYGQGLFVVE